MTFLELQRQIVQTRKARKGVRNRQDYFADGNDEEFWATAYKKALQVANKIIQHYEETNQIDPKEKISVTFGKVIKAKNTYDPKKQYVVNREKTGRPKHTITPEEETIIMEMRKQGIGINKISKYLKINNRQIMEICHKIDPLIK